MKIGSTASALPKYYYPQAVLVEAFRRHWGKRLERFEVLERLHNATQVDGRYLALPLEAYPPASWGEANNFWLETALELGQKSICKAVARSGIEPRQIGAFFFVSVTGIASPSVDARLINRMGLSAQT